MNLPKICPNCGVDLERNAYYYVRGIQYCNGMVTGPSSNFDLEKRLIEIDSGDSPGDQTVDPYEVSCSECKHILWEKYLIVNEEQFFVKKGEE